MRWKPPHGWRAYYEQRYNAQRRNIPFLLSFDEWLCIWETSGHLEQRGRKRGQYVMARFGDAGAYAIGNVQVITNADNLREPQFRAKISNTLKGRARPAHVLAKIRNPSPKTRAKMSAAAKARASTRPGSDHLNRISALGLAARWRYT